MPIVTVQLIEGRTPEQKLATAEAITDAVEKHCVIAREHIYVVFEDVAATDWMVAGETVAERKRKRGAR